MTGLEAQPQQFAKGNNSSRTLAIRVIRWLVGSLAVILFGCVLGPTNLASITWSHRLLEGRQPQYFPNVVLESNIGAGGDMAHSTLQGGSTNSLFPFEPWRQRAMLALAEGQTAEAATHLRQSLALAGPRHERLVYESLITYGESALVEGQVELAARILATLIEEAPDRAPAYVRLGEIVRGEGKYEEAIKLFEGAVAGDDVEPGTHIEKARAYQWIGVLHDALGNTPGALAAYRNAVREDPTNEGWYWAWNSCMALGREAAIRADQEEATAWFQQALAIATTGDQRALAQEQLDTLRRNVP